jgi:nicotinamidase-related amidase
MKNESRLVAIRLCTLLVLAAEAAPLLGAAEITTVATKRVAIAPGSKESKVETQTLKLRPRETAIVVCDMWDVHWCRGATQRVAELAPVMNEVIGAARKLGVLIVHAPSSTMAFYEGTPQRARARTAPAAVPPAPINAWRKLDLAREGPFPIDDSDGGCDDLPRCKGGSPWRRQIAAIEIAERDAISDNGQEVYNLLQQHGIQNVIVMGVHANMCVLGRSFAIRQMVELGKNVYLMRDMTDTMYNSRMPPYVSHFRGTDRVVEHIEQYWCPSIASTTFTGREPFQFKRGSSE